MVGWVSAVRVGNKDTVLVIEDMDNDMYVFLRIEDTGEEGTVMELFAMSVCHMIITYICSGVLGLKD